MSFYELVGAERDSCLVQSPYEERPARRITDIHRSIAHEVLVLVVRVVKVKMLLHQLTTCCLEYLAESMQKIGMLQSVPHVEWKPVRREAVGAAALSGTDHIRTPRHLCAKQLECVIMTSDHCGGEGRQRRGNVKPFHAVSRRVQGKTYQEVASARSRAVRAPHTASSQGIHVLNAVFNGKVVDKDDSASSSGSAVSQVPPHCALQAKPSILIRSQGILLGRAQATKPRQQVDKLHAQQKRPNSVLIYQFSVYSGDRLRPETNRLQVKRGLLSTTCETLEPPLQPVHQVVPSPPS
eukprot:scaffold1541_cov256-Pinguiococcus_pyrenoidosus.AAC.46